MKNLGLALGILLFANLGFADIYDRIDQCEKGGGGACVYDILRELAQKTGGPTQVTRCSSHAQYTGELCCQVACYYPKVAKCTPPNHPSICRSATCVCQ